MDKIGETREGAGGSSTNRKRKNRAAGGDEDDSDDQGVSRSSHGSGSKRRDVKKERSGRSGKDEHGDRPSKRKRTDDKIKTENPGKDGEKSQGKSLGGLIGKKRKERKAKGGK